MVSRCGFDLEAGKEGSPLRKSIHRMSDVSVVGVVEAFIECGNIGIAMRVRENVVGFTIDVFTASRIRRSRSGYSGKVDVVDGLGLTRTISCSLC